MRNSKTSLVVCLICVIVSVVAVKSQNRTYSHLRPTQIAGKELYIQKKCGDCHTLNKQSEGELTPVNSKRSDDWFRDHVAKESPVVLGESTSARKMRRILDAEITALDDYLYKTSQQDKTEIDNMPGSVYQGAFAVYKNNCLRCHMIAGTGAEDGADLTFIADKRGDPAWLVANLIDPTQFKPETTMPKFDELPESERQSIVDYLMTLRK